MSKNIKDFIIRLAAYLIFLATTFLPYDKHILRGVGCIIFFTVLSKDGIQNVLFKGNRKDITILVISFMIFCVVMILPIKAFPLKFIGIFIYFIAMYKDNIKEYLQRFRKKDNKL